MDAIVEAALRKWPNVPHCYGWLALDARGDWYMRDERIQAAGPFPQIKGSRIEHDQLRGFIERNYAHDDEGAWFFQNGPQRVYLELEAAPWVWRLDPPAGAVAGGHGRRPTGRPARGAAAWREGRGRLFLDTDIGFGIVHSMDMLAAAQALEEGGWPGRGEPVPTLAFAQMPVRFGYRLRPQPPAPPAG